MRLLLLVIKLNVKQIKLYLRLRVLLRIIRVFLKEKQAELAVIKIDAIGDYILFRNYLAEIKHSKKYKDKKLTLIGNIVWKELAESFDSDIVNNFIWLDRKRFETDFIYRWKFFVKVSAYSYEYLISPTYSRDFILDKIIYAINANYKIGSVGDLSNISYGLKRITDRFYDKLIPATSNILFEFERNQGFMQDLLDQKLNTLLQINLPDVDTINKYGNYVVFFIGASENFRRWHINNFIKLAEFIYAKYDMNVVFCGLNSDMSSTNIIPNNNFIINLIGKTTQIELLYILQNAQFVVSNETSVPHICVALDVNVLVLSNGNNFGRFTNYPKSITDKYYITYHPDIEVSSLNNTELMNLYQRGSKLNINDISVHSVQIALENMLENIKTLKENNK